MAIVTAMIQAEAIWNSPTRALSKMADMTAINIERTFTNEPERRKGGEAAKGGQNTHTHNIMTFFSPRCGVLPSLCTYLQFQAELIRMFQLLPQAFHERALRVLSAHSQILVRKFRSRAGGLHHLRPPAGEPMENSSTVAWRWLAVLPEGAEKHWQTRCCEARRCRTNRMQGRKRTTDTIINTETLG